MDKSIMCATCARYQYGFNFCKCPVFNAQPATPEPPEWVSPTITIPAGTLGPNDALRIEGTATWENGKVGKVDVQIVSVEKVESSPLDRALEDFTARRKAKREEASKYPPGWDAGGCMWAGEPHEGGEGWEIARAMSTPLPHDPDIHTRVMPWRGKE